MKNYTHTKKFLIITLIVTALFIGSASAVTSEITRHGSVTQFQKGQTENTLVTSEGTITLAGKTTKVDCDKLLKKVWIVNSVVADTRGTIYIGTSPHGDIIRHRKGKAEKIYPPEEVNDPNTEPEFRNEHVFALALDAADRLLAAVSGQKCQLLRFDVAGYDVIFTPEEASYILCMTLDKMGNIYLGTGPDGKIYRLDPFGKDPKLIYDSKDKNILSLAVADDGFVYAGTDDRGIIYKINQSTQAASVLYDSQQSEITSLIFDKDGNLYAAATSAKSIKEKVKLTQITSVSQSGRPDNSKQENSSQNERTTTLTIANTNQSSESPKSVSEILAEKGAAPSESSHIYRIDPLGYVTDIFSEMAVFFNVALWENKLLLGTGNNAQLITIDPVTEEKAIAYEDKVSAQITSVTVAGDEVLFGCSNPAKLIKLKKAFADEGTFTSALVDADQPARWGKLQIDADIPQEYKILLSTRSGNVDDPNDPTFSPWTKAVEVTKATQIMSPLGRFCQYKFDIQNKTDKAVIDKAPVIREVAVAYVIPNLPPKVQAVSVQKSKDIKKEGYFIISYKAEDDNKDDLIYQIDFRKLGRDGWIKLEDKLTSSKYEWNSNTVEDGRYEVRITADDSRSNSASTALTGSRISDPFVVDNTAPEIVNSEIKIEGSTAIITLSLKDQFTVIGRLYYTVDSNEDWVAALPEDMVYDTTEEEFTIAIEDLEPGRHVVAFKITDDLKNTTYKTFEIEVK